MKRIICLLAMGTLLTGCGEPDKGEWVQMTDREEWLKDRCVDGFNALGNEYILEQLIEKDNENISSFRGYFGGNIGIKRAAPLLHSYDSYTFTCSMSIVGEIPVYNRSGDKAFTHIANNIASIRLNSNYEPVEDWMENKPGFMIIAAKNEIPKDKLCEVSGEQVALKIGEVKYVPKGVREDDDVLTTKFNQFVSEHDESNDLCTVKIMSSGRNSPIVATYAPPKVTNNVLEVSDKVTQRLRVIKHQDYPDSFKGFDSIIESAINDGCSSFAVSGLTIPRDVTKKELGYNNVRSSVNGDVSKLDYNKYRCTINNTATDGYKTLKQSSSYDFKLVAVGAGDFDAGSTGYSRKGYGIKVIGTPSVGDIEGLTRKSTAQQTNNEEVCQSIFEANHDFMREQFNTYWPKAKVTLKTIKKVDIKKNVGGNPNAISCDFALTSSISSLEPHMVFTVKSDSNRNISEAIGWSDIYDPEEDLWWSELQPIAGGVMLPVFVTIRSE